jgi:hypothetical protein
MCLLRSACALGSLERKKPDKPNVCSHCNVKLKFPMLPEKISGKHTVAIVSIQAHIS